MDRISGFYWVKLGVLEYFIIAMWNGEEWLLPGAALTAQDEDMEFIDENILVRAGATVPAPIYTSDSTVLF